MRAEDVIQKMGLQPLPGEGGFYREVYRSPLIFGADVLPEGYDTARAASTAIYYLITPETFSALHRLQGDEVWHFYVGDPVEQLRLHPDGTSDCVRLGNDVLNGFAPQTVVPGGVWQTTRLVAGGHFALMGTTMAPGFDFREYEGGKIEQLVHDYPILRRWPEPTSTTESDPHRREF